MWRCLSKRRLVAMRGGRFGPTCCHSSPSTSNDGDVRVATALTHVCLDMQKSLFFAPRDFNSISREGSSAVSDRHAAAINPWVRGTTALTRASTSKNGYFWNPVISILSRAKGPRTRLLTGKKWLFLEPRDFNYISREGSSAVSDRHAATDPRTRLSTCKK